MLKGEILAYLLTLKPGLESQGIVSIGLFGSYANDTDIDSSDIDILIETSDRFVKTYRGWDAFVYIDEHIRDKISQKFNKKVDIFDKNSNSSIKPMILEEVCYV